MKIKNQLFFGAQNHLGILYFRAFTLIELLVVIAIIGMLSSVVLVALSTARNKGNDAKVQAQLQNMRAAAEIWYSVNKNYGVSSAALAAANCSVPALSGGSTMFNDANSGMVNLVNSINYYNTTSPLCNTDAAIATKWLAYHAQTDTNYPYWCVDSTGQSKKEASAPANNVYICP